jgi:hypothetical protein
MRSHLPEFVDQSVEYAVELGVHRVGIGSETTECSDAFTQPQGSSVWPTSGSPRNGCGSAAKRRRGEWRRSPRPAAVGVEGHQLTPVRPRAVRSRKKASEPSRPAVLLQGPARCVPAHSAVPPMWGAQR